MKNLDQFPLWTAVITPMDDQGKVDYESFKTILLDQQAAHNACVILGSTAEALNLDLEEKKEIVRFATHLNLAIPLMCGIGGHNINETKEWLRFAETLNFDAYLMVTPIYAKPGMHGQYEWFKSLMDIASRPVMLYNVPGRSATALNVETVSMLKQHPRFWAIKEASGKVEDFKKYAEAAPNAKMYSGDDSMMADFAPHRCIGLVSVASNTWPKETHLYMKMALKNELKEINEWKKAADSLFLASNPVPVKKMMFLKKQIKTPLLRAPLDHRDLNRDEDLLASDKFVQNWFKQYHH